MRFKYLFLGCIVFASPLAHAQVITTFPMTEAGIESPSDANHESTDLTGEAILRLDRNGDGQLDNAELATAKHLFTAVDRNNDGKIDAAERAHAKRVHDLVLRKFDTNRDGQLNKHELWLAHEAHRQRAADAVETPPLFESVDHNSDGILSDAELNRARYVQQRLVQQFDEDGDGKLDPAENQTLREARQNASQEQGDGTTVFEKADRNDDGKLQKSEKDAARRIQNRQDRDQDGQVGPKEKEAAKKRGAKKPSNKDVPKRSAPKIDQLPGGSP